MDRYFYFAGVREHDSLFRHVAHEILKKEPTREGKGDLLDELRRAGVLLIDLKLDPADGSPLAANVGSLVRRVRRLQPEKIILIKATVYDTAFASRDAGFPVVDEPVPFGWRPTVAVQGGVSQGTAQALALRRAAEVRRGAS